jgi:tetratricopeptide (TPR) repeat protein
MNRAYCGERWESLLSFLSALKEYLYLQGHWREAARRADHAIEAARHLQDPTAQARWTFYAGLIQGELGEYEEAESYYRKSLDQAQAIGETAIQAEVWRRLGWLAHARGERGAAKVRYKRALELHRQNGEHQGEARDRRQLALVALEEGKLGCAERLLRTSLALVEKGADWETQQLQAGAWLDLGRIALRQGRLDEARRCLERARRNAGSGEDRLLLADIDFHLAALAEERGEFEEAARLYRERLDLAKETGDRRGQASVLIALGTVALRRTPAPQQTDYDQARHYYDKALEVGDNHNQAVAMVQLGTLVYLQANHEEAAAYLQEALSTFQDLGCQQEIAACHQQLGLVAQALGQWRQAGEHYQASLNIRLELGLFHEAIQSLYQLGTLAQHLNQPGVARRYYEQAFDMGERVGSSDLPVIRQALEGLNTVRDGRL